MDISNLSAVCEECEQEYSLDDEILEGLCVSCGLQEQAEMRAMRSHSY